MLVFHLATAADWAAAQASGRYTTSTRGRTLAEEGFIHTSRADQWQEVRRRWYADVTDPLVLLVVDTDLLEAPVVEEAVAGSRETFPHVYGVLETTAVVRVVPLDDAATTPTAPDPDADPDAVPGTVPDAVPASSAPAEPPAEAAGTTGSFSRVYLREVYRAAIVASSVLAWVVVGALVVGFLLPGWEVLGALLGLVTGVWLARRVGDRARAAAQAPPG